MGCGKSTIAKLVSKTTQLTYIDTDSKIEKLANMSIMKIFEKYGEHKFRQLEQLTLKHINKKNNLIIATGGATLINNNNYKIIQNNCLIIFLNTDFNTCFSRIKKSNRPLVKLNTKTQLKQLFNKRQPQYEKIANFKITETANSNIKTKLQQTLEIITKQIHQTFTPLQL